MQARQSLKFFKRGGDFKRRFHKVRKPKKAGGFGMDHLFPFARPMEGNLKETLDP